jgi:hypothetical protein
MRRLGLSSWRMTESDLVAALRPVADALDALGFD